MIQHNAFYCSILQKTLRPNYILLGLEQNTIFPRLFIVDI